MKLKKAKLWRVLWRKKSLTGDLVDYYATTYEDFDQESRSSSRSSYIRSSDSRSSDSRSISSDTSYGSVLESTSMSNNDTNSNGEIYGSQGKLTTAASFDVGLLRRKRADTGSSTGSNGKSSRPKSLPVEDLPNKSHSKHRLLSDPNEDHTPSRYKSNSKLSSEDEASKIQLRHSSRVHSIPEMPESHLTKSCEVPPVTSKIKKDMKKSQSIPAMSMMIETPTSSKSRGYDVITGSRTSSTSSHESDEVIKKSSSKGSKISNIDEEIHDDHNNNHEHKSKKSKKKDKDRNREREKEKDKEKDKMRDSPAPIRPKTLDLNITTPEGDVIQVEEEEEEIVGVVTCSGHEHKKEHIYLDEVYHFNVDQLFELLFTDSEFYRNFLNARKTFDLIQAPWPEDPDENGEKKREIGYTLSLNYSIGPKVSQSAEKQTILAQSKPGHLYVIEADCTQAGIPYGENFFVHNRYCITRVSSTRTRLIAQSEIKYKKNVWGLVKNFIEKNAVPGTKEYFNLVDLIDKNYIQGMRDSIKLMSDMLRDEADKSSPPGAAAGRKKMLRKRRPHASVPDRSPSLKRSSEQRGHVVGSIQGQSAKGSFSEDDWHIKVTADSLVYFVCAILLVLVLFNVLLFYKLWSLESKASSLHQFAHRHTDPIYAHPASPPHHHHHSPDEWNHVIEQQHRLHELELERWKDVFTASVSLVDQMKITLQELLANIEHRTQLLAEMAQQQKEASKH